MLLQLILCMRSQTLRSKEDNQSSWRRNFLRQSFIGNSSFDIDTRVAYPTYTLVCYHHLLMCRHKILCGATKRCSSDTKEDTKDKNESYQNSTICWTRRRLFHRTKNCQTSLGNARIRTVSFWDPRLRLTRDWLAEAIKTESAWLKSWYLIVCPIWRILRCIKP